MVIDYSWKLVFTSDNEFDNLLEELRDMLDGLGYEDVCQVDFKNAQAQTAARQAVVEKFTKKK